MQQQFFNVKAQGHPENATVKEIQVRPSSPQKPYKADMTSDIIDIANSKVKNDSCYLKIVIVTISEFVYRNARWIAYVQTSIRLAGLQTSGHQGVLKYTLYSS